MTDERWLTVQNVVDRLQVHEETVRRWLRLGRLKGRNFGGKMGYRITEADLQCFVRGRENGGVPPADLTTPTQPQETPDA